MDTLETSGYWWRPGSPNSLAGSLAFRGSKYAELKLLGVLPREIPEDGELPFEKLLADEPILLGATESNERLTLRRCKGTGLSIQWPGISTSIYAPLEIIRGAHFESEESLTFYSMRRTYPLLDEWIRGVGFDWVGEADCPDEFLVSATRLPRIGASWRGTADVVIEDQLHGQGSAQEVVLSKRTFIEIRSTDAPQHLVDLGETAWEIETLLSLLLGQPVHPSSVQVTTEGPDTEADHRVWIDVYHAVPERPPVQLTQTAFCAFGLVAPIMGAVISEWAQVAEDLTPVLELYRRMLSPTTGRSASFMSTYAAIEAAIRTTKAPVYLESGEFRKLRREIADALPESVTGPYRQRVLDSLNFSNEFSQADRLRLAIEATHRAFLPRAISADSFVKDCKDTRNYLTHYDARMRKKAKTGDELDRLTEILRLLLEVLLLQVCGISDWRIAKALSENQRLARLAGGSLGSVRVSRESSANTDASEQDVEGDEEE